MFKKNARAVSPHEAKELIDKGALIIDVRELSEWNHGHAPEAVHIPMVRVEEQLHKIPKDCDVIVCCRSGSRSSTVTSFLLSNGYKAVNMNGGMAAWHARGLPVVNSNGVRGNII
ncbi:MAG: rhodanese-like domain-containing protein [Acidimicrobiaceae bacterium]|nr:rhodanese-like domain-containing protein [Acidimicrobiaceae bacterium]